MNSRPITIPKKSPISSKGRLSKIGLEEIDPSSLEIATVRGEIFATGSGTV
jgi:hypothetical protein